MFVLPVNGKSAKAHYVILTGIYADTPARAKISKHVGSPMAYLPCQWCWLTQTREDAAGSVLRFRGYSRNVVCVCGKRSGVELNMEAPYDPTRVLSANEQHERARAAESSLESEDHLGQALGVYGYCSLLRDLPYLDYNNVYILPFAHAFLLGVLKDFVFLLLGKLTIENRAEEYMLSNAAKRAIKAREKNFILTSDFGRPYTSVLTKSGMYVMEHWSRFIEVYSVYLFSPYQQNGIDTSVLSPKAMKAWGHIRRFFMYHAHPDETYNADRSLAARAELMNYAKMLDEVIYNL